jgi:hypothetical protein
MSISRLGQRLYPSAYVPVSGRRPRLMASLMDTLKEQAVFVVVGSIAVTAWLAFYVYYYNRLVDLESSVQTAKAQILAKIEQRHYVQKNLLSLGMDDDGHEQALQQLAKAIIDTEVEIAAEITNYNHQVNLYTNALTMYPSAIIAKLCRFRDGYRFYRPPQAAVDDDPLTEKRK